jgi:hypothetical protein
VIQQVTQGRRNTVVVFAADHYKRVGRSVQQSEPFENRRRLPFLVFFVHPVQQRQLHLDGIDECEIVSTRGQRLLDLPDGLDALAVGPDGAHEDDAVQSHDCFAFAVRLERFGSAKTTRSNRSSSPSDHA